MNVPTVQQTTSLAPRQTSWFDTLTLDQIDPALGLQSLGLSLTGTLVSTAVVTNEELAPATFGNHATGSIYLERPDGTAWLALGLSSYKFTNLPAATESNAAAPVVLTATTTEMTLSPSSPSQPSSDTLLLTGTGQVTLPVIAASHVEATGPGNMIATFATLAGASVTLQADATSSNMPMLGGGITEMPPPQYLDYLLSGTILSPLQTVVAAEAPTGTTSTLTVHGFDPALGWLAAVHLSVTESAAGTVKAESLDNAAGLLTTEQRAILNVEGVHGDALATSVLKFLNTESLLPFDGTVDFLGSSGGSSANADTQNPVIARITGAALADFVNAGTVDLQAERYGTTTISGPGNLDVATTLQAGATIAVSYEYYSYDLQVTNVATSTNTTPDADAYTGPVAGLEHQYIWAGAGSASIQAIAPNIFLKGGAADDALAVRSGNNVLDGGGGSNFLIGGTGADGGHDTFFVDARGGGTTWSTITHFHSGDMATIFGFNPALSTQTTVGSDGAAGHTGYTIHAETGGAGTGVNASLTFAGIDASTAAQHFVTSTGSLPGGIDYLLIQYI